MALGKKTGGRKKGTPNKPTADLHARIAREYPGYCPIMAMIAIAHDTDDATMAFNAHKEVARYIKPQLKAIEHSTGAGGVNLIWDTGVPGWGKNETKG